MTTETNELVAKEHSNGGPNKKAGKSVSKFSFSNIKVGMKIGGGFAVILLILATVATVSVLGLDGAVTNFKNYRGLALQTNQMGRIQANLLSARLGVKDYVIKGTDAAAKTVEKRIATLNTLIKEAEALFKDPDKVHAVEKAEGEMAKYASAFQRVIEFRAARNTEVDKLNAIGPKTERNLTQIMKTAFEDNDPRASFMAGTALRHLMLARLYANRFLVENGQAQSDRVNKEMKSFLTVAQQMKSELQNPVRQRLAGEVLTGVKDYSSAFNSVVKIIFERNDVIKNTLDRIGPQVAGEMESIKLDNKKAQDTLGPLATESMYQTEIVTLVASAIAIVFGAILAFFIGRAVSRPIINMTTTMEKLAGGDLQVTVPGIGTTDEVGQMADAVQVFKDSAIEVERLKSEQEENDRRATEEKKAAMKELADKFEASVGNVVSTVVDSANGMQTAAQTMSETSDRTSNLTTTVAAATEEATVNVQTVASAAEELSSSITEISRQVSQSSGITQRAVTQAGTTNTTVRGLAEAAQKIGEVVSLINDIAAQTNLLALNATIEAARAGDAGKGFAVVASEVKSLANQTAKATEEIADQINGMQEVTSETVNAIESIGATISEVNEIAGTIAAAVEEQGAATQEIARNVSEAAEGTQEVSRNIVDVTKATEESGASAKGVLESVGELTKQADILRNEVNSFLGEVRSA